MALFSSKKMEEKKDVSPSQGDSKISGGAHSGTGRGLSNILKHARITEKATMHQEGGVYTFDVEGSATKQEIMKAVRQLYKVNPVKVRVVAVPSKQRRSMRTGQRGISRGGKKAYVHLKKGETITIS